MGFQAKKALREKIYVKIALMSPSGGGKSFSALRVATGMANQIEKETGKRPKILVGNTEQKRGYYYANEFDYDIVDIEAPHNPEKYVEFLEFAVSEGYGIVILDSSSHEWEGKGGCLELQQQAGGTYQAWGKVTPRHNKFIEAIADSPIHLIATMRGKDQYETEKDDRGKISVKKLGIGAKQRDGFEYEFTCTFLIDQKTHMAETQKDNTHIFEADQQTLLTERHGEKIIQWANSGEGYTPPVRNSEPKNDNPSVAPVDSVINEIMAEFKGLISEGVDKDKIYSVIESIYGKKNFREIKDIDVANKVLEAVKALTSK